ncbi:DNA primase subunit [Campylobacter phage CP39]|nr:DNA primase subunit [Campylobacter phage CP39]
MLNPINVKYWEIIHNKEDLGIKKSDDYNCKCDVCGDSKYKNKKRLHLYRKDSYTDDSIKCFNCGYTATMYSYIKTFHPIYLNNYLNEIGEKYIDDLNIQNITLTKKEPQKPKEFFSLNLPKASEITEAKEYILKRGGNPDDFYYCKESFVINDKTFKLPNFIIYLNTVNDSAFSFYSRSINDKIFYIFNSDDGFKVMNYFNIDPLKEVYVFEGLFDMLCTPFKNKIAMLGATLPKGMKVIPYIIWCCDNDETGRKEMLKHTNNPNHKFVVWCDDEKFKKYKDINEIYQSGVNIENFIKEHTFDGLIAECKLRMW